MNTKLMVDELPKDLADRIKKENGVAIRKVRVSKNEIQDYATSTLSQLKGLDKSDKVRAIHMALKMLEV